MNKRTVDHLGDYDMWIYERRDLVNSLLSECEMTTSKHLNLPVARYLTTFERFLIDKIHAYVSLTTISNIITPNSK